MIYFMQPVDGGPIKIGCSVNVDARHRQLEAHYRRPLSILATIDGGRDEERALHEQFAHLRLGRTEQFRPDSELLAFIGRPFLVDPNPNVVEAIPPAGDGRADQIRVAMTPEFKAWLQDYANSRQLTMSDTVVQALIEHAARKGFKSPPKR